jgi:hypothetical protein
MLMYLAFSLLALFIDEEEDLLELAQVFNDLVLSECPAEKVCNSIRLAITIGEMVAA